MNVSILIVDDNDMDRYILRRYLKKCSFDVKTFEVEDGQAALDYFVDHHMKRREDPERYPPMIVFLDINMPRVDGFGFLEQFSQIRAEFDLDATVVIMFTSSPRQEDKDRSFQWNFVKEFIVKGDFSADDLDRVIQSLAGPEIASQKPSA